MKLKTILKQGLKGMSGKNYFDVDVYRAWTGQVTTSHFATSFDEIKEAGIEMETGLLEENMLFFTAKHLVDGIEHKVFMKPQHSLSHEYDTYRHLVSKGQNHTAVVIMEDMIMINDNTYLIYPLIPINREENKSRNLGDAVRESEFVDYPKAIAKTGIKIAEVLEFLHGNQVFYFDLKPDNIVTFESENAYWLRFIDFESSRVGKIDTEKNELVIDVETDDYIFYTISYAAPELVALHDHITANADIYSAGCTLYDLFMGERNTERMDRFESLSNVVLDYHRLIRNLLSEEGEQGFSKYGFVTPSLVMENAEPNGPIPRGLAKIISKCVCIKPEERYSAIELKNALTEYVAIKELE